MKKVTESLACLAVLLYIAFSLSATCINEIKIQKLEDKFSALQRLVTIQDSLLIKAIEEECK